MIYFIMGKSSSGKDTLLKNILAGTNLQPLVTYTTRPMRPGEINGREYYFVDNIFYENNKSSIIEERQYNTRKGIWRFFSMPVNEKDNYVVVGPLQMFLNYKKVYNDIVPLYIELDDRLRLERAIKREKQTGNNDFQEMERRFVADNKDFKNIYELQPFVLDGVLSEKSLYEEFLIFIQFSKKYIK